MRRALLLAAIVLTGCDKAEDAYARSVAENAQRRAMDAESEISTLKQKIIDLEEDQKRDRAFLVDTFNGQEGLRKTVNNNAKVSNENALKDMTRRGACGREWSQASDGQWFQTNKVCTEKDLAK